MGVIFGIFTWVPITPDTVNQQIISWLKILRCPFLLSQSEFFLSLVHSLSILNMFIHFHRLIVNHKCTLFPPVITEFNLSAVKGGFSFAVFGSCCYFSAFFLKYVFGYS